MDDSPGDNVELYAEQVEAQLPQQYRSQNDEAHLYPSRWWFASSAFPLIAGTLGPVASAFSICALARPWRQHIGTGESITTATFIDDPPWLIAVNAIQLIMALAANALLLLNMARRVRFSIAQPITIVGWYTSAVLLLALCATAAGPLMKGLPYPADQYRWSQAFYYGIFAAILYFAMASCMSVTFWGAWTQHYDKDFILTTSQRTLMLQSIIFLMYLLLGALVFSNIEGWNYLDAVYWADVTLFTVGFGDFSPATNLGRALLIPYAFVGIITLGLVIASIRSMILERGRRRVSARVEERVRRRTVRNMATKGDDHILSPMSGSLEESLGSQSNLQSVTTPANEYERRRAEFELMRGIQNRAETRRRWIALAISSGTWMVLWLVGALIFVKTETQYQQWSYFDAFYFCFTALTTIGYGDKAPVSPAGRSFFVFWSLLALPTMTVLISNAGDTIVKFIKEATLQLGNITILPGDEGFTGNIKHVISRLTLGRVFKDFYVFPKPQPNEFAAYLSEASEGETPDFDQDQEKQDGADERGRSGFLSVESAQQPGDRPGSQARAQSTFTSKVRRSLSRIRDPLEELPSGTDLHFLLISEIQHITQHLSDAAPHKYSFEEWAWYLRLIGEDERNPENHRKPRPKDSKSHGKMHHDEHDVNPSAKKQPEPSQDDQDLKWSWVGHRSPLMGSQEESEWILDRLTNRLRESLSAERRRQLKRKPRTTDRLAKSLGAVRAANAMTSTLDAKKQEDGGGKKGDDKERRAANAFLNAFRAKKKQNEEGHGQGVNEKEQQ